MNKFKAVRKKNLAQTLNFLGFRYYKIRNKQTGEEYYKFKDSEEFRYVFDKVMLLKEESNLILKVTK